MWYEALPSLFLTGGFVFLGWTVTPFLHKFCLNGNPYARKVTYHEGTEYSASGAFLHRRDERLGGGNKYNIKLLENIPN